MKMDCTAEGFSSADRIARTRSMGAVGLITAAVGILLTAVSYIESTRGVAWFVCDKDTETQNTIWLDYKLCEKHADEYDKNHKD